MTVEIICGDCVEVMVGMEAGSVDLLIADPPYGAKRPSAWRLAKDRFAEVPNNDAVYGQWLSDAYRILADRAAIYVFCCWQTMEKWRQAMNSAGFAVRSCIVWDKMIHGLADLQTCYAPRYEMILLGNKGRHELRGPRPKDVIAVRRISPSALLGPYQKPVELLEQLVRASSKPGDLCVDPFTGSGATGVACVQTGRNFIGIEIDEGYCEIARRRIAEAQMQPAMELA